MIEKLDIKEWLDLNAKLQKKKNALRKALKEKGVLKKDRVNEHSNYQYFSEAGYKNLFTELLSQNGLELTSNEISYEMFETTNEKMPNGRHVTFEFKLSDVDTGFYEVSVVSGEGLDVGDKAGYKADTGAIKYYLANTFLVATGDDPENDSPEAKTKSKKSVYKASEKQINYFLKLYSAEEVNKILAHYKVSSVNDLNGNVVSKYINDRSKENKALNEAYNEAVMSKHEDAGDRQ